MAATDKTYRNQRVLDIVFGVSCVLMLLSVVWMFVQDYNREFKSVQRDFRRVEEALNEFQMIKELPDTDVVRKKHEAVDQARQNLEDAQKEVSGRERELIAQRDIKDMEYRTVKADFDSRTSYYNIDVEHLGKATDPALHSELEQRVQGRRKELEDLGNKLATAQRELDEINQKIKVEVSDKLKVPQDKLSEAEDDLKKTTAVFDRFAKATAQKSWGLGYELRAMPILDAFESPVKIRQVWLPDLTIDYGGFKDVPRFDRCISCHLGIDRATFSHELLEQLTRTPDVVEKDISRLNQEIEKTEARRKEVEDNEAQSAAVDRELKLLGERKVRLEKELDTANKLQPRLDLARESLQERAKTEKLGFNPKDVPSKVRWLKLTKGQIKEYATHPRLDLFVDGNSPHPMEKFGCTACHAGQGSATDFLNAVHTPATAKQEEEWHEQYGWKPTHFWDFPMHTSRFIESSCLKCHHEVTDLIRAGSKEEAPKLLRGYYLVQENGCFGCHEISGIKSGREVGPDLRTEPTPALEYLTASEQDRAKADPLNPPGTYRKVGPSLRRIAEKTNQEWARKWIQSPRGFRPNTKMPHFYGLSNNSAAKHGDLQDDDLLPDDQKAFPDAEISSITHYLFYESKGQRDGSDFTHKVLEKDLLALQERLKKERLPDRDRKNLADRTRRLGDLALLSVPAHATAINEILTQQRSLQEHMQELQAKSELSDDEKQELERSGKELDRVTERLLKEGRAPLIARELFDGEGRSIKLPEADDKDVKKRVAHGRQLFSERGCMACHSHEGTTKEGDGLPAVLGTADFAPNLSRVAAKIAPEGGDKSAARRWLVQWIMNPTIYHPRTRMPVTHLDAKDAGDVADWLLSQEVKDWDEKGPPEPSMKELVSLARVYLGKAPGMTPRDVDDYLPMEADTRPGVMKERMEGMPFDADERMLAGPLADDRESRDKLKWYIGRKAITRLGCFGCHDVPGFETAKPIGTALNDWGKKDPERLAFEDADIFVRNHHTIVETRNDPEHPSQPDKDWKTENNKEPYEGLFFEALKHHHREGFLHQKLTEPRSFDYHRIRTWDDRLRMPQFRFARATRKAGESDEAFQARETLEEAEAREAVMTFILGLVAEPVPLKYVNSPKSDRLAEVKGRQVIDKFNCAGCHQVSPGIYDVKPSTSQIKLLETAYQDDAAQNAQKDHVFPGHNAWTGTAPASADRMTAVGTSPYLDIENYNDPESPADEPRKKAVLLVRLANALRFTGSDHMLRDLPAGSTAPLLPENLIARADAHGGDFTNLMVKYLNKRDREKFKLVNDDNELARSMLPPPLFREGERVQPDWLYGFLRNPPPVRPTGYMLLRMPKFNMSAEDARALVNYFTAAARLNNPGAGVSAEYLTVPQTDVDYWTRQTGRYVARLEEAKQLGEHRDAMKPLWDEALKARIAEAEVAQAAARDEAKKAKGDAQKQKEQEATAIEARIKEWKKDLEKKDYGGLREQWQERGAYATDAYRLLTDRNLCLQCHNVGSVHASQPQGPDLALSAKRLRPEWVQQWIANPNRLFTYKPAMPQNFPKNPVDYQNVFKGSSLEQATAVRDVLMDLPRLADMPGIRPRLPAGQEEGK